MGSSSSPSRRHVSRLPLPTSVSTAEGGSHCGRWLLPLYWKALLHHSGQQSHTTCCLAVPIGRPAAPTHLDTSALQAFSTLPSTSTSTVRFRSYSSSFLRYLPSWIPHCSRPLRRRFIHLVTLPPLPNSIIMTAEALGSWAAPNIGRPTHRTITTHIESHGQLPRTNANFHVLHSWWLGIPKTLFLSTITAFKLPFRVLCFSWNQIKVRGTTVMSLLGSIFSFTLDKRGSTSSSSAQKSSDHASSSSVGPATPSSSGPDDNGSLLEGGRWNLANLELYEATMRPTDRQICVDVTFHRDINQWELSRSSLGTPLGTRPAALRPRDDKVLLLCSRTFLAGISADTSVTTVRDHMGRVTEQRTQVHHLAQNHGIPGFQHGELSQLNLSSHDTFTIRNLMQFLRYAGENVDAIIAATAGGYMKTWIVTVPQMVAIMADEETCRSCKEAFFKLHNLGFASSVHLQLVDGNFVTGGSCADDALIMDPQTWMEQHANVVRQQLRINTMQALSFFSAGQMILDQPELRIIHPKMTPGIGMSLGLHLGREAHQHVQHDGPAQARGFDNSPLEDPYEAAPFLTHKAATLPRSRREGTHSPVHPIFQHPLPYPQPPNPEFSTAFISQAVEMRMEHIKPLRQRAGSTPQTTTRPISSMASLPPPLLNVPVHFTADVRNTLPSDPLSSLNYIQPVPRNVSLVSGDLPLRDHIDDAELQQRSVQAVNGDHCFTHQFETTAYCEKSLRDSGLIFDPEIQTWVEIPKVRPLPQAVGESAGTQVMANESQHNFDGSSVEMSMTSSDQSTNGLADKSEGVVNNEAGSILDAEARKSSGAFDDTTDDVVHVSVNTNPETVHDQHEEEAHEAKA